MTGMISERQAWNSPTPGDDEKFELAKLGRAVRRQLPLVAFFAFIGAALAAAMVIGSVQRFIAIESILLDEERSNLLDQVSALPNSARNDSAIQSEIEIIKSRVLAEKVVDRLNLDENTAFLNPPTDMTRVVTGRIMGLADPILNLISPQQPTAPAEPVPQETAPPDAAEAAEPEPEADVAEREAAERARDRAIAIVRSNLFAGRAGRSLVIQIGYEGYDAERAAAIVRAFGNEYTQFQLESTTEDARNAGRWIQQRLDVLEQQSLDAARTVQEFRADNNLIEVRGDLLTDQQQSEMTSKLIDATAETAQAKARLDNFESLLSETDGDVITVSALETGTPSGQILNSLRSEYLELTRRQESVESLYGPDHSRAVDLAERAAALEDAIAEELNSAIAAIRADYAIAQSREETLRSQIEALSSTANDETADLGRLRQLEAISQTYAAVYRDYLERYELTTQQQGFPIASVRILSRAEVPRSASSPRKKLMLATGLTLGALLGIAIGAMRELRTQPLRTGEEVRETLGLSCAGLAPKYTRSSSRRSKEVLDRTLFRVRQAVLNNTSKTSGRVVGLAPAAEFRDALSMVPRLCTVLSMQGETVLVVDVSGKSKRLRNDVRRVSGAEFTTGQEIDRMMATDVQGSDAADGSTAARYKTMDDVASEYDFVLLLLPPLTRTIAVDPLSGMFDVSVMTIPWGKVSSELISGALRDHQVFASRLATTVLEGANLRKARRYMRSGDYEERIIHA
ncbi:GumC family protein [Marivita sp.]|uniref:GumC family protein n=1 Tax=Marivita sp. TaxID=2003365 RepID=UPI0025C0EA51|nr:GumC family protein [Marivita sp.]